MGFVKEAWTELLGLQVFRLIELLLNASNTVTKP